MNPQQFLQVHDHNNEYNNRFAGCCELGHDAIHPEPSLALAKLAFDSVTDSLIFPCLSFAFSVHFRILWRASQGDSTYPNPMPLAPLEVGPVSINLVDMH